MAETIGTAWLGDATENKKYAHSVTSAVYDPESGQTLDKVIHPAYSTEEQWTGEYFENSDSSLDKVYRRMFEINSPVFPYRIQLGIRVKVLIDATCFFLTSGNEFPVPMYTRDPAGNTIFYLDKSREYFYLNKDGYEVTFIRFFVKYTKQEAT